jgi:hypothetical protein
MTGLVVDNGVDAESVRLKAAGSICMAGWSRSALRLREAEGGTLGLHLTDMDGQV